MTYTTKTFQINDFPPEDVKAVKAKCGLRRADRFTAMAVYAVSKAFSEQFPHFLQEDAAIITASSFGPINTTLALLDDILDYPEDKILPTKFSHSVHNAITSYACAILGIHGPAFALTNNENQHETAIATAKSLLDSKTAPHVLIIEIHEKSVIAELLPQAMPEKHAEIEPESVTITLVEP